MSIAALLDIAEGVYGIRTALGPRESGLSYSGLSRATTNGAEVIRQGGYRSVAFVGVNAPVVPVLLFASARAGVPFVPLNYRLSAEQLGRLVSQLDRPLVLADEGHMALANGATRDVLSVEAWLDRMRRTEDSYRHDLDSGDDAAAVILFTSGTTAEPKGVTLRHGQLMAYALQTVELASAEEDEVMLVSVPPYHVAGIASILTNVYGGRRMVYLSDFHPARWMDLVRSERVTNAMVVPTMLSRIVASLEGRPADTPSLRTLAYGGARMSPVVLERAMGLFPQVGFVNAYGLTETSSTIAVLGPDDHRTAAATDDPRVRSRLGSVGRLVSGMEGQVRDAKGSVLPLGEIGELWVRGPQVSGDYHGLGSVLDEEGWFPTRDLARFDEDGYLFIEGRSDDTIIRGGENIAPAEIEDVLERHPRIGDVAVVGAPDEEWGQRIVAVVVQHGDTPIDAAEVRSFVRERLRGSRTPDDVIVVDELPYGPTGKLLRRELLRNLTELAT